MFGRKDREAPAGRGRFTRDAEGAHDDSRIATATERRGEGDWHEDEDWRRPGHREPDGAVRDVEPHEHREHSAGRHHDGTIAHDEMRAVRARQRDEFGGIAFGSAFFGWLVAFGMAAILTGLLGAAGAATGLTESADNETVGLAGGIALLVAAAIAYFCGGYVAGRLARFDGAKQGAAVWLTGLLIAVALGALAVAFGEEFNVVDRANLPRFAVGEDTATTAGIIASVVILLGTLLAAVLGGKAGERFHKKVDRHATH